MKGRTLCELRSLLSLPAVFSMEEEHSVVGKSLLILGGEPDM